MLRKTMMSVMVIAMVALFIGVGTYAYFSSDYRVNGNTTAIGDVEISGTGGLPFNFSNMEPGGEYSTDVSLTYDGTINGDVYFGLHAQDGDDLTSVLEAAIYDRDNNTWVTGWTPIGNLFGAWTLVSSNTAKNVTRAYTVHVRMKANADNSFQNKWATAQVILYATQVGAPAPANKPWEY